MAVLIIKLNPIMKKIFLQNSLLPANRCHFGWRNHHLAKNSEPIIICAVSFRVYFATVPQTAWREAKKIVFEGSYDFSRQYKGTSGGSGIPAIYGDGSSGWSPIIALPLLLWGVSLFKKGLPLIRPWTGSLQTKGPTCMLLLKHQAWQNTAFKTIN